MTHEQAKQLCGVFPTSSYTRDVGYGRIEEGGWLCGQLKSIFPEFNWRVILDQSGERQRWVLTVDDNDPREHYFDELGGHCTHCGKTARELAVGEEEQDDGGAIAVRLKAAKTNLGV